MTAHQPTREAPEGPIDVIGDVHGEYDKLRALLRHLGYRDTAGTWRHATRRAIFVGDLIDRGPGQVATVNLVRRMVESGAARCILGNHEFNAIAWATPDPGRPGKFLRDHDKPGNYQQHQVFLQEVHGTSTHASFIDWFKTLPLWIDLGGIRIVHACWHQASMDLLAPHLGPGQTLTDRLIWQASQRGSAQYQALENICKGPEVALPAGGSFPDKEGNIRHEIRVCWWRDDESRAPAYAGPPVLFGHYWFGGMPTIISPRFACVDFSVARGGPLVAYRWDGEQALSSEKLAWM